MKRNNVFSLKKVYFWNTMGGVFSAAFFPVLVMMITRMKGTYDAGIFSLGYANALLLQHVGSFDSRSYQCTERTGKFDFSDFLTFRFVTSLIMIIAMFALVCINKYSVEKIIITIELCVFCVFNNISDIFQGNAQKNNRLDIAGISLTIRTMICIFAFGSILIVSHNIYVATLLIIICTIIWILYFDIRENKKISKWDINFDAEKVKLLFWATIPLFLSLFFQMFIYNIPKYAIDEKMSVDSQAIYSILFVPASVVTLLGNIVFRPILVNLSLIWENKKYKKVLIICVKRIGLLMILTVGILIGGYLFGTQILTLVYAVDITAYKRELLILLLGGGFTGITTLLYFVVTVVGKQHIMVLCYVITFISSLFIARPLVIKYGLMGAALCYLVTSFLLNILLFLLIVTSITKKSLKLKSEQECM